MIFIDACFNKETPYTPIWIMRQAGRYLNEYMNTRKKAGDFLSLCTNPELACEVSLQPIDILNVDACILFSDILVVPMQMGMNLEFIKDKGPLFKNPIRTQKDINELKEIEASQELSYVYDAIKLTRANLNKDKTLIGFCGSPWTLATYMVEGSGSKNFSIIKKMLYQNPKTLNNLLQKITKVLKIYLEEQIKSGVNALMIFDSWACALEERAFFEFSFSYIKEISTYIKKKYPNIPLIVFPKGIGAYLSNINGNFDVFGVDWSTPISLAKEKLGDKYILQGNLEPTRLYDKNAIKEGIEDIIKITKNKRHIFNLGHGILPDINVDNVKYLVDMVHKLTKK